MVLYQSRHDATEYGRLAQLVEHLLDVQEVTGSSPVPSTTNPQTKRFGDFLFAVAPPRQMWYTRLSSTNRNLKGAFSMASKKVEMYAKKRYELDEIKNKIKEEFDKRKFEFKDEIIRELGDTKTLLLIFENWFLRTGSYASLVIMLSEYQGYQSADIIATGGKKALFSFGAESDFAKFGEDALKNLGFQGKVR